MPCIWTKTTTVMLLLACLLLTGYGCSEQGTVQSTHQPPATSSMAPRTTKELKTNSASYAQKSNPTAIKELPSTEILPPAGPRRRPPYTGTTRTGTGGLANPELSKQTNDSVGKGQKLAKQFNDYTDAMEQTLSNFETARLTGKPVVAVFFVSQIEGERIKAPEQIDEIVAIASRNTSPRLFLLDLTVAKVEQLYGELVEQPKEYAQLLHKGCVLLKGAVAKKRQPVLLLSKALATDLQVIMYMRFLSKSD